MVSYNIYYITSKPRLNNTEVLALLQYLCYLTKKGKLHSTSQPSRCSAQGRASQHPIQHHLLQILWQLKEELRL